MYIGIDLGGTSIKFGVVSEEGAIISQHSAATNADAGKDAVLKNLMDGIEALNVKFPGIRSIGVGLPGVVDAGGIVYYPPNLRGWDVVPVRKLLEEKFSIPVAVDNDANVAGFAEAELGAGKNYSHFLFVTLGTGVGGCIIADHSIWRGERGGAGEVGHIVIDVNAVPVPGKQGFRTGTLEEMIGRRQILDMAKAIARDYPDSRLHGPGELDIPDIAAAANGDDRAAKLCFEKVGYYLGIGLCSALALLDMRIVIVGGGIGQAYPSLLDTTEKVLRARALPTIAPEAAVLKATFSNDAGLIGAALLGRRLTNS